MRKPGFTAWYDYLDPVLLIYTAFKKIKTSYTSKEKEKKIMTGCPEEMEELYGNK